MKLWKKNNEIMEKNYEIVLKKNGGNAKST